jgi:hypothetical protein
MTLGDWLTLTLVGLFVVVTFWWAVWLAKGGPKHPMKAVAILVAFLLGLGVPTGGLTWLTWHLTQTHSEHVCMTIGNPSYNVDNANQDMVLSNQIYANTDNLPVHAGERWCGVVRYEVGASYPWLVSGGPAR